MSANKNILLSYERQLLSNLNVDINQTVNEQFLFLLNSNHSSIESLYMMNKLLPTITNYNDICLKYYTKLLDNFKHEMNQKNNLTSEKTSYRLVLIINALSNFIKIFSSYQEKYNEKHKSILKQLPQFLQVFNKLFQQNKQTLLNSFNKTHKIINSFFIFILTILEYYPTLLRSYQNNIEIFIKDVFTIYLNSGMNNIDNNLNIAIVTYVNLYKLSPNLNIKFQEYLTIIINNIKYYLEYFKPKTIDNEENSNFKQNEVLNPKNNLFLLVENNEKNKNMNNQLPAINNSNLVQGIKIIQILFEICKNMFVHMTLSMNYEINFKELLTLFSTILNTYDTFLASNKSQSNSLSSSIIFNGLSKKNYELFLINVNEKVFDLLNYFISNYSRYIYCFNIYFEKILNKILLNQKFFEEYTVHKKILELFNTVICYLYQSQPDIIDLIIYKHMYNIFPILYLKYLENQDKTLLKVDDIYFKASTIKKQINNNINNMDNNMLSNQNNTEILFLYFKILKNYCHMVKNINYLNHKIIISGFIDLIILPPYAKFIFNIDYDLKKNIIELIEICVKRSLIIFNKTKLCYFLQNFILNDGDLKYNAYAIMNIMKITESDFVNNDSENNECNDITGNIIDFNKKIKDFFEDYQKKLKEMENNDEINKKEENLLNKKRKISDEKIDLNKNANIKKIDFGERKGNTRKNQKKQKEKNSAKEKEEDNIPKDIKNEENNEINIDEEIDIPDII